MVAATRTGCSGTGRSVIVPIYILVERTPSAGQFAGNAGRGRRGLPWLRTTSGGVPYPHTQFSASRLRTPSLPSLAV